LELLSITGNSREQSMARRAAGVEGVTQLRNADEKRPAGLVTAEAVEQADGVAAADVQQLLERRAVDERGREAFKLRQSGRNVLQPLGWAGHTSQEPAYLMLWHSCAKRNATRL
jgi:hypothetical protein